MQTDKDIKHIIPEIRGMMKFSWAMMDIFECPINSIGIISEKCSKSVFNNILAEEKLFRERETSQHSNYIVSLYFF